MTFSTVVPSGRATLRESNDYTSGNRAVHSTRNSRSPGGIYAQSNNGRSLRWRVDEFGEGYEGEQFPLSNLCSYRNSRRMIPDVSRMRRARLPTTANSYLRLLSVRSK